MLRAGICPSPLLYKRRLLRQVECERITSELGAAVNSCKPGESPTHASSMRTPLETSGPAPATPREQRNGTNRPRVSKKRLGQDNALKAEQRSVRSSGVWQFHARFLELLRGQNAWTIHPHPEAHKMVLVDAQGPLWHTAAAALCLRWCSGTSACAGALWRNKTTDAITYAIIFSKKFECGNLNFFKTMIV